MDTYKSVIDLEKLFKRSEEIHSFHYPLDLDDSIGILVEEDRSVLPSYQARPGPYFYMFNDVGAISKEQLKEAENACGMNAPESEMYNLRHLVYGLNKGECWGRNLFYSSLIVSNNVNSQFADETTEKGWHYMFRPGIMKLGITGRVLMDREGNMHEEEVYIQISPDMVYDALANGGLHCKRIALIKQSGNIEVVKDFSKYNDNVHNGSVPGKFSKRHQSGKKLAEQFKHIDLTEIASKNGMTVVEHPFYRATENFGNVFYFSTVNGSKKLQEIAGIAESKRNFVWRLASMDLNSSKANHFLINGTFHVYDLPGIFADNVSLGQTGRSLNVANNRDEDGEWPSNWQSEYVSINIDKNMITSALFELDDLDEIIGFEKRLPCSDEMDGPFEIIYKKGTDISPENRVLFETAKENPDELKVPEELLEGFEMRGLKPTAKSSMN